MRALARKEVHFATLRAREAQAAQTICVEPFFPGIGNSSGADFSHQVQVMAGCLQVLREASASDPAGEGAMGASLLTREME